MGDHLWAGIPSRYVTSQLGQLSLASLRVAKPTTGFRWGKGWNVTSAGWQVTLCAPIWHVSSSSGVATLVRELLYPCYFTYLPSTSKSIHFFNQSFSFFLAHAILTMSLYHCNYIICSSLSVNCTCKTGVFLSSFIFCTVFLIPCGRFSWLSLSFSTHLNILYHIVSRHFSCSENFPVFRATLYNDNSCVYVILVDCWCLLTVLCTSLYFL